MRFLFISLWPEDRLDANVQSGYKLAKGVQGL